MRPLKFPLEWRDRLREGVGGSENCLTGTPKKGRRGRKRALQKTKSRRRADKDLPNFAAMKRRLNKADEQGPIFLYFGTFLRQSE